MCGRYHVFADVSEFAGGQVILTESSNTLKVEGIALRKDGTTRVVVANLSPESQRITVQGLGSSVRVGHMNEVNLQEAMIHPTPFWADAGTTVKTEDGILELSLLPYAIARIDST